MGREKAFKKEKLPHQFKTLRKKMNLVEKITVETAINEKYFEM